MHLQGRSERLAESFDGDILHGVLTVRAGTETTVNGLVRVHEEGREGQVEVELEQRQVHAVALDDPHTHETVHQVLDLGVMTNNLLVQAFAGLSRNAAEDDEQGLARLPGPRDPFREVVVNPESRRADLGPVIPDFRISILQVGWPDGQPNGQQHGSRQCSQWSHHRLALFSILVRRSSERRRVDLAAAGAARTAARLFEIDEVGLVGDVHRHPSVLTRDMPPT